MPDLKMPKNLLDHAEYELKRAGFTDSPNPDNQKIARDVLALIRRFRKQDHGQYTGPKVLEFFDTLGWFLPLTPITDNPEEWEQFDVTTKNTTTGEEETSSHWQCKRAPSIISEDGGKTFTDMRTGNTSESLKHEEWLKDVEKQKQARLDRKRQEAAKTQAPNVKRRPDTSVPADEVVAAPVKGSEPETPPTPEKEADKGTPTETKESE